MVKHHKKKNKKSKPVEVPEPSKEQLLKDLDRFAGSSEEEDNDDINDVKNDNEIRESEDTDEESISGVDDDDNDEDNGDILDGEEADEEHDGDADINLKVKKNGGGDDSVGLDIFGGDSRFAIADDGWVSFSNKAA